MTPEIQLEEDFTQPEEVEVFAIPEYPTDTPLPSNKAASEDAFYSVSAVSQDPLTDFLKVQADLRTTGKSSLVDAAKARYEKEQDISARAAITDLMSDPSISDGQKQALLTTYVSGGFIKKDLRDRYMEKQVVQSNAKTLDDDIAQDNVVSDFGDRLARMKKKEKEEAKQGFFSDVIDYAKAGGAVFAGLASTIPAGLVGLVSIASGDDVDVAGKKISDTSEKVVSGLASIYSLVKDRDPQKAERIIAKSAPIFNELDDTDEGARKAQEKLGNLLNLLDIPAEFIGDKLLDLTGSPGVATAGRVILDPVNLFGISAFKGRPKIKAGSPIDATIITNKPNAAELAKAALFDETGKVAEALGTSKGVILEEMVLPKIPDEIVRSNPDLTRALTDLDRAQDYSFNLHRYDPNVRDVEIRQQDLQSILSVINETGSPYFQQANSTITSPGNNIFEGTAVYGRSATGNYVSKEGAEFALTKMQKALDSLSGDLKGELDILPVGKEFVIRHAWRKEYPPLNDLIFGANSLHTTFAGIPINNLKHTPLGKWILSVGVFPKWFEAGKERSVDRGLKQANDLLKPIKQNIANTPYRSQLKSLVDEANQTGQEWFDRSEISSRFPDLSSKQVQELQNTHVFWRRAAQFEYRILNNTYRDGLQLKGTKSIYDGDGNFVADAVETIQTKELAVIEEVFDMASQTPRIAGKYTKVEEGINKGKVFDEEGRQLVLLDQKVTVGGEDFNYGLLDPTHKVDTLRGQPLPRISGWSPRVHLNHFFIDSIPKTKRVDGIEIKDPDKLKSFRKALAGAKTSFEAENIASNLRAKHPELDIVVRADRLDTYQAIVEDYQTSADLYADARRRGDLIENTTLQDPLQSLINTAKAVSNRNVASAWEQDVRIAFVKSYGKFLEKGEFPTRASDIQPKGGAETLTKADIRELAAARALFDNYSRFKNYTYTTDTAYKTTLHWIADVLEDFKVPANLFRDFSKKEFPLVSIPKKAGSLFYINLNIPRQWFIQPQQAFEIMSISPKSFPENASQLLAISTSILGESPNIGLAGKVLKFAARNSVVNPEEMLKNKKAIIDSGIIDSIDSNVLVNGLFHDTHLLITTPSEKIGAALKSIPEVPSKIGRSLGYDPSELVNKIGIWLQMKSSWIQNNPGKDWDTPATREFLADATFNFSGNMNKAGNLPYQKGLLSPLFQFSAIGHKMFINQLVNTATPLSVAQRSRLAAVRAVSMGLMYGVPGGGIIYALVDEFGGDEIKKVAKNPIIKRGISEYIVNEFINSYYPSDRATETSLGLAKSVSPFGETGVPYGDFIVSTLSMIDGKNRTNPRFPLFGVSNSLFDLSKKWETLWYSNDFSSKEKLEIGFREALMVSPGFNNWFKANLIIGTGQKLDSLGNPNGLTYTVQEGFGLLIGVQSNKDEWAFEQLNKFSDNDANIRQTAEDIYTQISFLNNMFNPDGTPAESLKQISSALDLAVTNEGFTPEARQKVMEGILQLAAERRSAKDNLIMKWINDSRELSKKNYEDSLILLKNDPSIERQQLAKNLEERNL